MSPPPTSPFSGKLRNLNVGKKSPVVSKNDSRMYSAPARGDMVKATLVVTVVVKPCSVGQYTPLPVYRGSFGKTASPGMATKFTAVLARPAGGGGTRASNARMMALPTMCPPDEQGL